MRVTIKFLTAFLLISVAFAIPATSANALTFSDNSIYWPGWKNNTDDDNHDTIGTPDFKGGTVVTSGGFLKSITINQSSAYEPYYGILSPGDLFIDANADKTWDYFIDLTSWATAGKTNADNYAAAGRHVIWSIALPLGNKSGPNPGYILSGKDDTNGWSGYLIRDGHPVAVADSVSRSDTLKGVDFTGWHDLYNESWTFTFDDNAIELGKQFTIGWTPNCGNDVLYETMSTPVPEPATMFLLGTGLLGMAGFMRRKQGKKHS